MIGGVLPLLRRRSDRRVARVVTIGLSVALVASALAAVPPPAAAAPYQPPPQVEPSVPGTDRPLTKPGPDPDAKVAVGSPWTVTWPAAQSADVDLTSARSGAAAADASGLVQAGGSPVWVGQAQSRTTGGRTDETLPSPGRVRVDVLARPDSAKSTVDGPVVRLVRGDRGATTNRVRVELDYSGFRHAYGGGWESRLRLVSLPECALTTPEKAGCQATPLASTRDLSRRRVAADVGFTSGGSALVALTAGASGSSGTFGATALSPSATWSGGGSSGDFNWAYPISVPPALGGPTPTISLAYSSGSADGRTAATNNQASWVGLGFEFWPGQIERKYKPCAEDMSGGNNANQPTGDQCWFSDNATMSLNGSGSELVRVGTSNVWRPKNDDGSRVELLTDAGRGNDDNDGEYWRVTTADGTQYYFGYNRLPGWRGSQDDTKSTFTLPVYGNHSGEACHQAAFANSACRQAYRWNLDYVVDIHGNTMSYFYNQEIDNYAKNGQANAPDWYVRGGTLKRVDYGQRSDAIFTTPAVGQVVFDVADRCSSATNCGRSNPSNYPDVPWDTSCENAPCNNAFSPAFWTQKRLTTITTRVLNNNGSDYRDVDSWSLRHSYVDPDDGTGAALWLEGITHTGLALGTAEAINLPEVTFDGDFLYNRVDDSAHHVSPLAWRRIIAVTSETGGKLGISYSAPECSRTNLPSAADSNTKRCMPAKDVDPAFPGRTDWFHKYVVTQVTQTDTTTGLRPVVTSYEYVGTPAWHFDEIDGIVPVEKKTWAQWRGYGEVRARVGDGTDGPVQRADSLYFRGMDGDRLANGGVKDVWVTDFRGAAYRYEDADRLAGVLRQATTYNGDGGAVISRTIEDPWVSAPTATQTKPWGTTNATKINTVSTHGYYAIEGGTRETEVRKTIEADGRISRIHDRGDINEPADDLCTRFEYVSNTTANLIDLTTRVLKQSVGCDVTARYPEDVISDGRSFYDGSDTFGSTPTRGLVTRVDKGAGVSGGNPRYVTTSRATYDAYGRVVTSTDVRGKTTTTAYTPATGGPLTRVTTTDPLGVVTYSDSDPAWGAPVTQVNQTHNLRTEVALDALGRVTKVWGPTRPRSGDPDAEYAYKVRNNGPIVVTTRKLQPNGNYQTKYELYDGLLRMRQTQLPAVGGGRAVADVFYDSRGLITKRSGPYKNDAPPDWALLQVTNEATLPNQIRTEFDGAGRSTAEILYFGNGTTLVERWRTTTTYGGDRIHTDPPAGATATTTVFDTRGRTKELRQYFGDSPTGGYDATRYTYTPDGQPLTVTDPAGNVWRSEYDELGRLKKSTDPDKGVTTLGYNDFDELVSSTDSRGTTLTTSYDGFGRPAEVRDTTGGGSVLRTSYTYDTLKLGLPTSTTRWVGSDAYKQEVAEYDSMLRPTKTRYVIPLAEGALAGTYEFGASYNVDGSIATSSMPGAGGLAPETLTIGYNDFGLNNTLSGLTNYVTGSGYTPFAEPWTVTLNNGTKWVEQRYSYDVTTRRMTGALTRTQTSATPIANLTYTYDPAGNVTKISDTPTGLSADHQCFKFDYLRRMTDAWTPSGADCAPAPTVAGLGGAAPFWHSYTYDKSGNRLTETRHAGTDTTSSYTYPTAGTSQPHTLTGVTTSGPAGTKTVSYGYDTTGNTSRRTVNGVVQDLQWDAEGKLAKVTEGSKVTSFLYDASGERLIRRDPTGTTLYLGGMELRKPTSGGVTATRYYEHGGQTIAVRTDDNKLTWLIGDMHGTHTIAIDASSPTQAYQRRRSTPFGEERGTAPASWAGDKGFVGGTKDDSTGFTHLGAREYDPTVGRFLSVDPIVDPGDPQQMHGYSYASNNPSSLSDPDGLMPMPNCGPDGIYCGPGHEERPKPNAGEPPGSDPNKKDPGLSDDEKRQRDEAEAVKKKSMLDIIKEQGLAFLLDFLGITDIVNCFTKGDLGACVSTLINFIPWGKVFKAGKAIVKGINKAFHAYKSWQKAIKWADDIIKKTDDLIKAARKKADDAAEAAGKKADDAGGAAKKADEAAESCTTNSFTSGTQVLLADGTSVPIEELRTGDKVLATDDKTGATGAREVTATITGEGLKVLVDVTVDVDGVAGDKTATVTATNGHPFWVDSQATWRRAAALKPGDQLRLPDGSRVRVIAVVAHGVIAGVHNLTVADVHTYYVLAGTTPVLVHNCDTRIASSDQGRAHNAAAFEENGHHGFSGVYDPATDTFHARQSGGPGALVGRGGGHGQINREVYGGSRNTIGFVAIRGEDGVLNMRWNSLSVNMRNFGDRAAPQVWRGRIMDSIRRATGLEVVG